MVFFKSSETASCRTNHNTDFIRVYIFYFVQFSIFDSFICCNNCELNVSIHFLSFFWINIFFRVKVFNFTRNFYNVLTDINKLRSTYSAFSFNKTIPKFVNTNTKRCNCAKSCDNYSSFCHLFTFLTIF